MKKEIRTVKKIKIVPLTTEERKADEVYQLIRDERYTQNQALNFCMSLLATKHTLSNYNSGAENRLMAQLKKLEAQIEKIEKNLAKENLKEEKREKELKLLEKYQSEKATLQSEFDRKTSHRTDIDVQFDQMYTKELYQVINNEFNFLSSETSACVVEKAKKDFKKAMQSGYAAGRTTLPHYRLDGGLMMKGRSDAQYEKEDWRGGLHLYYEGEEIHIRWVNGIIFKVVLGSRQNENSVELQHTLYKIAKGEYRICQSTLNFDKNNHLILSLVLRFNLETNYEPIKGRVLGVDLGIKYPAYLCLNDDTYKRQALGSVEDFLKLRLQMKKRRQQLQGSLKLTKGGKGRKKKLQALDQFKKKERNFAKTYNHQLSKKIIQFAKQHQCEFIHLENLTKDGFDNRILANWSYYELQQMIEYKADRVGIKVRYVNPAYTSQTCCMCHHVSQENRKTQDSFKCEKCGFELNADHNAAINIARSTDFVEK